MKPQRKRFNANELNLVYSPNPRRTLPSSIGQLVVLNSGGPDMLITDINEDGTLLCEWPTDDGIREASFPPECLKFAF
jgi:uncharacterized protein YodC (DUF2158 family)